jgi:tetratricopeptide (TPR) repeat protein
MQVEDFAMNRLPVAVRSLAAAGAVAVSLIVALTLILAGGVLGPHTGAHPGSSAGAGSGPERGGYSGGRDPEMTAGTVPAGDRLAADIDRAQARLRRIPGDYATWAALGAAYLEQARIGSDASYYPMAEGALQRSLRLRPADNSAAMVGLGALANARHDFAVARGWALRAIRVDRYSAEAYGVLTDAETQLGHAAAATEAVQRMLDLRPGLPALTRAAYDLEQRGRIPAATALLGRALAAAVDPSSIGYCHQQLGDLAWNSGDLAAAQREYDDGLAADPAYPPLILGQARVAAARGDQTLALSRYAQLLQAVPSPVFAIEYADQLRAAGRYAEAAAELALAGAGVKLIAANGGLDDLTGSALALDQGHPAGALALALREWRRRQHADVADALGWALHESGKDAEGLRYVRRATATGTRNAGYAYHQAMIELSLGQPAAARHDFARALQINPYFSALGARLARQALAGLGWSA